MSRISTILRHRCFASCALISLGVGLTATAYASQTPTLATVQQKLASSSVPWVPNAGQWDARAAFRAQSFAGAVWVTTDGKLVHQFNGARANVGADFAALSGPPEARPSERLPKSVRGESVEPRSPGWVLTERFVGGAIKQAPRGSDPHIGRVSFMTSDTVAQADNLPSYGQVELGEVFPGVSVALKATNANVEKLFTVAPGRDPSVIRMAVDGAEHLSISSDGSLIAKTGNGDIAFTAPIAFQENERGERVTVSVAYQLLSVDVAIPSGAQPIDAGPSPTIASYTFTLGAYDPTRPLIIDPLLQSTFHGGSGSDAAQAVAIHPATGEIYIAGDSFSTDLPGVAGGAQSTKASLSDSFLARFNATLTTRLQSTYFGGSSFEGAQTIAIHPASGEVYVAGYTESIDLPGVAGGAQSLLSGGVDAFIARFNAALTTRLQSSYLGGTGNDVATSIAIHPANGDVFVAGHSTSSNLSGNVNSGGQDAFIARFNAALTTLLRSTLLGGAADESANALAIHPATGEVYIAGETTSANLPGAAGGAQAVKSTGDDAFIARFNAALTVRLQSTYLGGTGTDSARALAVHPATGDVYAAGYSDSTNLPGVVSGAQSVKSTGDDAFIARFNPTLTTLLQSTYLGGTNFDRATALAIHPATGEVYVAGVSASTDLPGAIGGVQSSNSGGVFDAFIARFNPELTRRMQSTYLGGADVDQPKALTIHAATGEVYIAGETTSANLPGAAGGAQAIKSTGDDAFISRISADLTALNRIPNPFNFLHQSHVPILSTRTSNEVPLIITPNPGNNQQSAYVTGAASSEFCVTNTEGCCTTPLLTCSGFRTGWLPATTAPYNFLSGDRVAVRHLSAFPGGTVETKLIVSGVAYPFRSSTGNANIACNLDMNGDNVLSATLEGLIILRAMLGFGGNAAVQGTGIAAAAWEDTLRPALNAHCGTNFPASP